MGIARHSPLVWSWMMRQPSGNSRKIRVNKPCGCLPLDKVSRNLSADERRLRSQHLDLQVLELQLAHFGIRRLVFLAIALQRRLPAVGFGSAGKESQGRRVPVARHESFQVMLVPGLDLRRAAPLESRPPGSARMPIGPGPTATALSPAINSTAVVRKASSSCLRHARARSAPVVRNAAQDLEREF